ncbi:hypothetical protein HDU86_006140, partial [Geranomyces michiganensis]
SDGISISYHFVKRHIHQPATVDNYGFDIHRNALGNRSFHPINLHGCTIIGVDPGRSSIFTAVPMQDHWNLEEGEIKVKPRLMTRGEYYHLCGHTKRTKEQRQ